MLKKISFILLMITAVSLYSQEYKVGHKEYALASKKPRYEFSFTYPVLRNFKSNITAMNLFNQRIESIVHATSDTFNVWMQDWDTVSMDPEARNEVGSYYGTEDSVFYATDKIISVHFYVSSFFAGSVHPNNSSFTVNYDFDNMKAFTLNDILKPGWMDKVSAVSVKTLMEQLYPGENKTDEWVKEGAGPKESNFDVFNITKEGILITFTTYQVASYANGPSEVLIPYADLKEFIAPNSLLSIMLH